MEGSGARGVRYQRRLLQILAPCLLRHRSGEEGGEGGGGGAVRQRSPAMSVLHHPGHTALTLSAGFNRAHTREYADIAILLEP
jgi:hypothetical protein